MFDIDNLTKEKIKNNSLPIRDILTNSLYYPASGFDGGVVKYFSDKIQSFIYCDYASGKERLIEELNTFSGYHIIGNRDINKDELIPAGWNPEMPPNVERDQYIKYQNSIKTPFAHWVIYERNEDRDASYGAKRFSLLYIGGEGVATYQDLYWTNHTSAKVIAIIQPGTGFGLNWTDFTKQDAPLGWVVLNNRYGVPETIIFGGGGNDYENHFNWDNYEFVKTRNPYYSGRDNNKEPYGEVTVWKRKCN